MRSSEGGRFRRNGTPRSGGRGSARRRCSRCPPCGDARRPRKGGHRSTRAMISSPSRARRYVQGSLQLPLGERAEAVQRGEEHDEALEALDTLPELGRGELATRAEAGRRQRRKLLGERLLGRDLHLTDGPEDLVQLAHAAAPKRRPPAAIVRLSSRPSSACVAAVTTAPLRLT